MSRTKQAARKPAGRKQAGGKVPAKTAKKPAKKVTPKEPQASGSGTVATGETRGVRKSARILGSQRAFERTVKEQLQDFKTHGSVEQEGVLVLGQAAEQHLLGVMEDANICAAHSKRVTIKPKDMQLVNAIRGGGR